MSLNEYLKQHLNSVAMITFSTDEKEVFQYNHWNYLTNGEFHLLNDDYTLGHILYPGDVTIRDDGAVIYSSLNHKPNKVVLNFYFGGAVN